MKLKGCYMWSAWTLWGECMMKDPVIKKIEEREKNEDFMKFTEFEEDWESTHAFLSALTNKYEFIASLITCATCLMQKQYTKIPNKLKKQINDAAVTAPEESHIIKWKLENELFKKLWVFANTLVLREYKNYCTGLQTICGTVVPSTIIYSCVLSLKVLTS